MCPMDAVEEFRAHALNPEHPAARGSHENHELPDAQDSMRVHGTPQQRPSDTFPSDPHSPTSRSSESHGKYGNHRRS